MFIFWSIIFDSWNARIKSRAATLSARTYVSWNARCFLFCYNTLVAEMHSVPFVTPHMTKSDSWNTRTKSRAAMLSLRTCDSWNAQCSFCYITYDSCNALMKSGAAMLSLRTYDSWNARCSFCYNTSIAEMHGVPLVTTRRLAEMHAKIHGWNQELQCSIHEHTLAEMHGVPFVTTHC